MSLAAFGESSVVLMTNDHNQRLSGNYNHRPPWAYYLERLYTATNQQEHLHEILRLILLQRDTAYFHKLKDFYIQQGVWEERREPLWQELSEKLIAHEYASLLAQESELEKLLAIVKQHPRFVFHYISQ